MFSDPPPSTRKRSAAAEPDLDRDFTATRSQAGGCLTHKRPWEHTRSDEIRNLQRSKRQRASTEEEEFKEKGCRESSGCRCSTNRSQTQSNDEEGSQQRSTSGDCNEIHAKVDFDKLRMPWCYNQRTTTGEKDVLKEKGGCESSGCRCSRKRALSDERMGLSAEKGSDPVRCWCHTVSDDEKGNQQRSASGDANEMHAKVEEDKPSMPRCQLFVNVGGAHISLQKNLNKTSVKKLVKSAYKRAGAKINDSYCTYSGKCLDEERLLSFYPIQRDATLKVQHRLRAGRQQTIECLHWNEVIAGIPRFHYVPLLPAFVDLSKPNATTAKNLSERIQGICRQVLVALCKVFSRGFSLDATFGPEHVLFYKGAVFFDNVVHEDGFTPGRGNQNCAIIHDMFRPVFNDETDEDFPFPLHAEHLLNFLFNVPAQADLTSPRVIAFLTNHSAVQSYTERVATCDNLDLMAMRLPWLEECRFRNLIPNPVWTAIQLVPALKAVLMFEPVWCPFLQTHVTTYGFDCRECSLLARNYNKHASRGVDMEIVEAAFSQAMSDQDFLPTLLQSLATLHPPLQSDLFDVAKLFGKRAVIEAPLLPN